MWAKLSTTELIEKSDLIVTAELVDQKQITTNQARLVVGLLEVKEVLKGDKSQTVVLLALPSPEGPLSSTDIFYKKGQAGLWFLRKGTTHEEGVIYLADHPQRFLPAENAADQIEAIRKILSGSQ